jgi:hypothetical protein
LLSLSVAFSGRLILDHLAQKCFPSNEWRERRHIFDTPPGYPNTRHFPPVRFAGFRLALSQGGIGAVDAAGTNESLPHYAPRSHLSTFEGCKTRAIYGQSLRRLHEGAEGCSRSARAIFENPWLKGRVVIRPIVITA